MHESLGDKHKLLIPVATYLHMLKQVVISPYIQRSENLDWQALRQNTRYLQSADW